MQMESIGGQSVGVGSTIQAVLSRKVKIRLSRSYSFLDDPVMHRSSLNDSSSAISDSRGLFFKKSLHSLERPRVNMRTASNSLKQKGIICSACT